jgi:hypothetical protein
LHKIYVQYTLIVAIAIFGKFSINNAFRFFKLHEQCYNTFTKYWRCLDNNNQQYEFCRYEEFELEECTLKNLVRKMLFHFPLTIS